MMLMNDSVKIDENLFHMSASMNHDLSALHAQGTW
jgi:hypothetical protein